MLITYEIHHTDGTILADGLSFEELPILFQAYQDWEMASLVFACYRVNDSKPKPIDRKAEFYQQWYELMDNLVELNNI